MSIQKRIRAIVAAILLVIVCGTIGYHFISHGQSSLLDCLYMTIITITTVGYREVVPIEDSSTGKIFTMVLLGAGMGLLAYGLSTMTAFFVEGELSTFLGRRKMIKAIEKMGNHFIVVGAGNTGMQVIGEMHKTKRDFIAIDTDEERLRRLAETTPLMYVVGDATHDQTLIDAGIERAHGLVTSLPDDRDNLFVTISARQLNPNLRIVAKGVEARSQNKLLKAGADSVVSPTLIGGMRMVSEMVRPAVVSFLDLMLRDTEKAVRIEDVKIHPHSHLVGKTLKDAAIRQNYGVLVMAVREASSETFHYTPDPDIHLESEMDLVVLGDVERVKQLREACHTSPSFHLGTHDHGGR